MQKNIDEMISFYQAQELLDHILAKMPPFANFKPIVLSPTLPHDHILAKNYREHFPQHALSACSLDSEFKEQHGQMLSPACCFPLFYCLTNHIMRVETGFTIKSFVFRNEDYFEPWNRENAFFVRDYVLISCENRVKEWINSVTEQIMECYCLLGLDVMLEDASDPFFKVNSVQKQYQIYYQLKQEFVVEGVAIGSINNHMNGFGAKCNIIYDGNAAYSACFGLGFYRIWNVLTNKFGITGALKSLEKVGYKLNG